MFQTNVQMNDNTGFITSEIAHIKWTFLKQFLKQKADIVQIKSHW